MKLSRRRNKKTKSPKLANGGRPREPKPSGTPDPSTTPAIAPSLDLQTLERLTRAFLLFIDDLNADKARPESPGPRAEPAGRVTHKPLSLRSRQRSGRISRSSEQAEPLAAIKPASEAPPSNPEPARNPPADGAPSRWDIASLFQRLQHCFNNNLLQPAQIAALEQWITQKAREMDFSGELFYQPPPQPPEREDYPLNCLHIRICYQIWDRQSQGLVDPTELGRRYKEHYLSVG